MAVGNQDQMHTHAVGLNKAAGCPFTFADSAREKYMAGPFKTRRATEDQVAKWPELAGMRNWRETERYWNNAPYLLWGKESVINAAQA
jgi:hypothetical protein